MDYTQVKIEEGLTNQLSDDVTRLLAGTQVRVDGTDITADDLQEQIKALLGAATLMNTPTPAAEIKFKSIAPENFAPTTTGVSKDSKDNGGDASNSTMNAAPRNADIAMPNSLRRLTGAPTVGSFLGNSMLTMGLGALSAINPVAGLAGKVGVSTLKGVTLADTLADIVTNFNPVTAIAKNVVGAIGLYDRAEGIVSSTADAYKTLTTDTHVPTTLAGRNVINRQVESEREASGTYDSSRSSQQRASTAALNRDNAPAYARPGYGQTLADAKNPAATKTTSKQDSSKSYSQAGGLSSTKSEAGHAPAGGVGPSPSGNGKNSSGGGSKNGGSSGGSSSGGGKSSGSGKGGGTGSQSYGGR